MGREFVKVSFYRCFHVVFLSGIICCHYPLPEIRDEVPKNFKAPWQSGMNGEAGSKWSRRFLGDKSGDTRFSTVSYLKKQHGVRELPDAVLRILGGPSDTPCFRSYEPPPPMYTVVAPLELSNTSKLRWRLSLETPSVKISS
jgi:hypothetical protein